MNRLSKNQKGFSAVEASLLIVAVVLVGAVGWFVYRHYHHNTTPSSGTALNSPIKGSDQELTYRWGWYADGPNQQTNSPTLVNDLTDVTQVVASNSFSLALSKVGSVRKVWVWGNDQHGQLNNGQQSGKISTSTPSQVDLPDNIVSIGEGRDFGLAVDSSGNVWAWGANDQGQLCLGNTVSRSQPVEIPGLSGVTQAVGGDRHSLFLLSNGTMKACGQNPNGQLGDGQFNSYSTTPVTVQISGVKYISSGSEFSAALKTDGSLWMWGNNSSGQLGNGTTKSSDVPIVVKIPNNLTVSQVFAGGDYPSNGHTLVILSNGSVWAWGNNQKGQLGNGGTKNSDLPVAVNVPAGVTFTYVAAGGQHSLALDSNGNVWAWGSNYYGQLGDNQKEKLSTTPIKIGSNVALIWTTANNNLDLHR